MKKFITAFLAILVLIISIRSSRFLYQSLDWSLAYCIDMVLMKFFAWSLDRGIWPYTDIYTYNLPMTIYINWVALKVFGDSSWGFRLLDVSWLVFLTGVTFIYLKRKVTAVIIALVGASLCLTLSENATNFGAFQRETMMLPFWILSLISYDKIIEGKSQRLHGFLLGTYICFSALVKPTGFLLLILILISLLWRSLTNSKFSWKDTAFFYLSIFVGGFLVLFFSLLPFIIHGNLVASFKGWLSYFKDLSISLEILSPTELVGNIFTFAPSHWFIPLNEPIAEFQNNGHLSLFHFCLISIYLYLLFLNKIDVGPFMILISGLLNYLIQAKGFAYHLFPVWFAVLLMITLLLDFFYKASTQKKKWISLGSVSFIIIVGITVVNQQSRSLRFYRGTELYTDFNQTKKDTQKIEVLDVLKKINSEIKIKPAKIQVFEAYHSVTLNSIMDENMHLVSKYPEAYIFYNDSPNMNKYKLDMLHSLNAEKPDIIVLNKEGTFRRSKDLFQTFPELNDFLKEYKLEKKVREINNVTYFIYTLNTENNIPKLELKSKGKLSNP